MSDLELNIFGELREKAVASLQTFECRHLAQLSKSNLVVKLVQVGNKFLQCILPAHDRLQTYIYCTTQPQST